jgi:hypothetical protein
MWRWFLMLAAVAILVPLLGCSKSMSQSNADLERQKLSIEVMHTERQELTSLIDAEKRIRAENQQSLQELERRRVQLQTMQQTVENDRQHLDLQLADANAKLAVAEQRLTARVHELTDLEAINRRQLDELAAKRQEIATALASTQSRAGAAAAKAQQTEFDRQKQATEKRVAQQQRARRQYLESLADATLAIVRNNPLSSARDNPQLARRQLLERLNAIKPGVPQWQFQEAANRTAEEFAKKSSKGTLTEAEVAKIRDFGSPQANRQTPSAH